MTTTPTLTGQDIGQAHYATRAVLEQVLAQAGLGFAASVALNMVGRKGSAVDENDLRTRVVHGLKVDESTADSALADLLDQGLVTRTPPTAANPQITLTPTGTTRWQEVQHGIAQITQRLYGGLPAEDLAVAHRILTTVTVRANAELGE
jgi:DNA-binding MarR family transcriptional regulator